MRIAIALQVGNEVELIAAQIAYHLSLGVNGIVIADLDSVDGTTEVLASLASDPRLVIRRFARDELVDSTGMHFSRVWAWTLEAARDHFAPDWLVRLDADEYLLPRNGALQAAFASHEQDIAVRLPRANAIFSRAATGDFRPPATYAALAAQPVVARPFPPDRKTPTSAEARPLILTQVMPKVAVRPDAVSNFTMGGHGATDAQGTPIEAPLSASLALVHFWFTTHDRFSRKASFLLEFEEHFRKFMPKGAGWQWSAWAKVAAAGPEAVKIEFDRQFPDAETLYALEAEGVVCRAEHLTEPVDG